MSDEAKNSGIEKLRSTTRARRTQFPSLGNSEPNEPRQVAAEASFTLIELLVVIGIIALLLGLLAPVFNSLTQSKGVSSAVDNVSEMVDLTRTEAIAKNTYTWLGFYNGMNNTSSQLWIVAVRSLDGTPTLTTVNTRVIGKVQKFDNILLTNQAGLTSNIQTELTNASIYASSTHALSDSTYAVTAPLAVQVNGTNSNFQQFITFTPQGEAIYTTTPSTSTPPTPFTTQMLIGLRKTAGTTTIATDVDSAALILYGGTGQVRQFRP